MAWTSSARVAPGVAIASAAALLCAVCILDVVLPLGYVAAPLYVIPVFVVGLAGRAWLVTLTGAASLAATFLVLLTKPQPAVSLPVSAIAFNRFAAALLIAIATLVVTALVSRDLTVRSLGTRLRDVARGVEAERRVLEAASTISPIGPWVYDYNHDGRITWSDEVATIHGEPPGRRPTIGEALSHYAPEDRDRLRTAIRESVAAGTAFVEEAEVLGDAGLSTPVLLMGDAVRDSAGHVIRFHGLVQDVSRLRSAEAADTTQRRRFAQLAASLPIYIWTADPEGKVTYFNNALAEGTGREPEELLGSQWFAAVHPDDTERVTNAWQRAVASAEPYGLEFRVKGADGSYRWNYVSATPERDETGAVTTWWGSAIDVHYAHEQRDRADALALERETMLDSIADGAFSVDREWKVRYANSAAQAVANLPLKKILGHPLWDVVPWLEETEVAAPLRAAIDTTEPTQLSRHNADEDTWHEISVTPTSSGLTVFFRNVTPSRRLAEQMAQAQRLESVGQLTGGIAHDFNNLLTVVMGGADALVSEPSITEENRELAGLIAQAARQGGDLTGRLLSFATRQALEPRPVDVGALLGELQPLLRRTLGEQLDIVISAAPDLPAANIDPGQLEAALVNLAVNARDAMPKGGALTIAARAETIESGPSSPDPEGLAGTYVVVSVADTGIGIDAETLPRVFDPFFTTKPGDKGSGLGLAMVWGFARQSLGRVTVDSEPGRGTTFRLYLPAAESEAASTADASPHSPTTVATGERILLVDDDLLVSAFAAGQLRAHGYEVNVASSGAEALAAIGAMEAPALLFTDVVMPGGLTGRDVEAAARRRWATVPVLYTSGYAEDLVTADRSADARVDLLAKPYTARQLLQRVRSAIDMGRAEP